MFTIWNNSGMQKPYWGEVDRVRALEALEDHAKGPTPWHFLSEDEAKKVRRVQNYRFVREQPEKHEEERHDGEALEVVQLMSFPVITLFEDQTLDEAWNLFKETKFRTIPVLNRQEYLVGILADREVFLAIDAKQGAAKVRDKMKTDIFSAKPETPVRQVAQLFVIERMASIPVVNSEGVVVGIVTRSDIMRTLAHKLAL